jgi:hypothetical protein
MSTRQTPLDRKARRAVMMVGMMLLLILAFAVWSYIARVLERRAPAVPSSTDERLVVIDNRSVIVQPEDLGRMMTDWLRSGDEKSLSFEFGRRSFQPNSAAPSQVTLTRVIQVASLAKASPNLTVDVLEPTYNVSSADRKLDDQRARGFRDALVTSGVNETQVTIRDESRDLPFAKSPYLAVLLSKAPNGQ